MALIYFAAGLLLLALAVGALAGPWWGVLVVALQLLALGVLEQRGGRTTDKPTGGDR